MQTDPGATVKQVIDSGYNVVILAFDIASGPNGIVSAWASVTNQQEIMDYVHSHGAVVLVSYGGSTEVPYQQIAGDVLGATVYGFSRHF